MCNRCSSVTHKYFRLAHCNRRNNLSVVSLKLTHVNKMGPKDYASTTITLQVCQTIKQVRLSLVNH